MRSISLLLPALLLLAACTMPGQPSATSSPSPSASVGASASPSGTAASPAADTNSLNGASIEVMQNGTPLKVEQKLADNDYGYQRDFVFGKYTIQELGPMPDDEVGVVYTDGNLYNNSSAIKLRLNLSKGRIYEVAGEPSKPNTDQHPGVATKELSEDKNTLVLYTYKGKMLDTGNNRKPTAEEYSVTIRNLSVKRP
jgi:hypothetical protein